MVRVEREQPSGRVAHEQPTVGKQLDPERSSTGGADALHARAIRGDLEDAAVLHDLWHG